MARKRRPEERAVFRVVIADDHRLLLEAMKGILEPVADMSVVGVTTDARELTGLLRELQPDLLVLDYAMPGVEGWSLLSGCGVCSRRCPSWC
jgi:DNA-binding NarL/FixJ family response regulator